MPLDFGGATAYGTAIQPVDAAQEGAQFGLQQGQRQAAVNALQGLNLNSPDSVGTALQGSMRAGAFDQASAIQNISLTRQAITAFPQLLARLSALGGGAPQQAATAPAAGPQAPPVDASASGPENSAPTPDPATAAAHVKETYDVAKSAADSLLATPLDQRPAAFEQVKQQMLARGIPEEAIDSAGNDLSDAGLKSLSDHYGALSAHAADGINPPTEGAGAAPLPPPHPSWYNNLVNDPGLIAQIDQMKALTGGRIDYTPMVTQATTLSAPEIAQQATAAHAGQITGEQEAAKAPYEMVHTTIHGVPVDMTQADFNKIKDAPGVGTGLSPEEVARQTAAGSQAGNPEIGDYSYTPQSGPRAGIPISMKLTKQQFLDLQPKLPGLGVSPSAQDLQYQQNDANTLSKTVATASDPARIQTHQQGAITGQQIMGLADTIGTGKYTPAVTEVAKSMAPFIPNGDASKYATNATALSQDLITAARSQFGGSPLPRVKSEFDMMMHGVPSNASPQDNIRLAGAMLAAKNNYEANYDRFMSDYAANPQNPKGQTAATAAWNRGPGQTSLLADPVFQSPQATFNGRPMVQISPKPLANGHIMGVYMPGTKQAQTFVVQ